MFKLLRCDLKRVFKDKLFLVVCIIAAAFAIINPLLYKIIFSALEVEEALDMVINAKSLFFGAFAPGGDFGLIMPILVSIIICKDFSYGTVRNKIISGAKRRNIFLSIFMTSSIVMCGIMLAYALATLGISLIFFNYQSAEVVLNDILYALLSVFFYMLVYIFVAALVSLLCVFCKNVGLVIVSYFGINFLFTIIGSVMTVALMFMQGNDSIAYKIIEVLSGINVFTAGIIGSGTEYTLTQVLYTLLPTVIGGGLFATLGLLIFRKKDLK